MENLEKPNETGNTPKTGASTSGLPHPAVKPYKPNPMRLYRFAVGFLSGILRFLFLADITGAEHMPKSGACFVCANHISNWDPVLVAIGRQAAGAFHGQGAVIPHSGFGEAVTRTRRVPG